MEPGIGVGVGLTKIPGVLESGGDCGIAQFQGG